MCGIDEETHLILFRERPFSLPFIWQNINFTVDLPCIFAKKRPFLQLNYN